MCSLVQDIVHLSCGYTIRFFLILMDLQYIYFAYNLKRRKEIYLKRDYLIISKEAGTPNLIVNKGKLQRDIQFRT